MRILTFTNSLGQKLILGKSPYLIQTLDGIEAPTATVQKQGAPYQSGSTFIDARLQERLINVTGVFLKRNLALDYTNRKSIDRKSVV